MRPFVSQFLLPLVKGGKIHVGRPIGPRTVEAMKARWLEDRAKPDVATTTTEGRAAQHLARSRGVRARALLLAAREPILDEATLRLGCAVHNLLALNHPALAGRSKERVRERVARVTAAIADLGPPETADDAVSRHTLLARLPEIGHSEHVVQYWLGRRVFVGRSPPLRLVAFPQWRRVQVTSTRRVWAREIGVMACARPAWLALHRASPLAEALDPLRLDPPLDWKRILSVLRFSPICRLVAGRVVEVGVGAAGAALAAALFRFASQRAETTGQHPQPGEVAFALRFLAHTYWLAHLFGNKEAAAPAGWDLSAMLVAAHEVDRSLVWPPDVDRAGSVGRAFALRLEDLRRDVIAKARELYAAALPVCRFAVGEGAGTGILAPTHEPH